LVDSAIVDPPNEAECTATPSLPLLDKRTSHKLGHAVARASG